MRRLISFGLFGAIFPLLNSCAAPGSAFARHSVHGKIVDSHGRGVSGKQVELVLPASYGMGGLDAMTGQPEDHGHRNQHATVITDRHGEFSHEFSSVYHITFFLLPPLGAFPRQPPKPFYGIRVAPRTYFVGFNDDHFDYRVIPSSGPPQRDSAQRVTGGYTLLKPQSGDTPKLKGWETTISIRQ
jgi:hypothetical protein